MLDHEAAAMLDHEVAAMLDHEAIVRKEVTVLKHERAGRTWGSDTLESDNSGVLTYRFYLRQI